MLKSFDILIIGGGAVGLSCALALAQAEYSVGVVEAIEPDWTFSEPTARVSALHRGSLSFLQRYGIIDQINACSLSPIEKVAVWTQSDQVFSPKKLEWEAALIQKTQIAQVVENRELVRALWEACVQTSSITLLCPATVAKFVLPNKVCLQDRDVLTAKLIIGADGARSWLRKEAGYAVEERPYGHAALTAVLQTHQMHYQSAYQIFGKNSILGVLPLSHADQVAVVWSVTGKQAHYLAALSPAEFVAHIAHSVDFLGELSLTTLPKVWPLVERHVVHYFNGESVLLLGDAAHTIHPLAGQGLNLGLMDVKHVADVLGKFSPEVLGESEVKQALREYSFIRHKENQKMIYAMRFLKGVCAHPESMVHTLFNKAFFMINKLPCVKQHILKKALYAGWFEEVL